MFFWQHIFSKWTMTKHCYTATSSNGSSFCHILFSHLVCPDYRGKLTSSKLPSERFGSCTKPCSLVGKDEVEPIAFLCTRSSIDLISSLRESCHTLGDCSPQNCQYPIAMKIRTAKLCQHSKNGAIHSSKIFCWFVTIKSEHHHNFLVAKFSQV